MARPGKRPGEDEQAGNGLCRLPQLSSGNPRNVTPKPGRDATPGSARLGTPGAAREGSTGAARNGTPKAPSPKAPSRDPTPAAEVRDSTPVSEREQVLSSIESLLAQASKAEAEARESEDFNLPPQRYVRLRRKSKDLQDAAMKKFGQFEPSLERVFHELDTDGSGFLEPEELQEAFAKVGPITHRPNPAAQSIRTDVQTLSRCPSHPTARIIVHSAWFIAQSVQVGRIKSHGEIAAIVLKLDTNFDGKIDLEEFKKLSLVMGK